MWTAHPLLSCALLVSAAVAVQPGTALASCAVRPVDGALSQPVQLVGRVVDRERGVTRFRVEEVWAGPDLAPTVWIETGQRARGSDSSSDLHPEAGQRYLVGASDRLGTNLCTAALITDDSELAALRPSAVRTAADDGLAGEGPRPPVLLPGLAVVLGGLMVLGLRRRHRALRPRGSAGEVGPSGG